MRKIPLWYPFVLSCVFAIYGTIFTPGIRLCSFAPFLAISFYRVSFIKSLWLALICGLLIDTISSQMHFGIYGLCHCITAALCYPQRKHFFEDKAVALSLFSALISSIFSLTLILLSLAGTSGVKITGQIFVSDVIIAPVFDAIYAFLWFTLPLKLYQYIASGQWKKHFTIEQQEDSE